MIDRRKFFDQPIIYDMKTKQKIAMVKEMIAQLVAYKIIFISKKVIIS